MTKNLCQLSLIGFGLMTLCLLSPVAAQTFDERYSDWPVDLKINGRLMICGHSVGEEQAIELIEGEMSEAGVVLACCDDPSAARVEALEASLEPTAKSVTTILGKDADWSRLMDSSQGETLFLIGDDAASAQSTVLKARDSLQQWLDEGKTIVVEGALVPLLGVVIGSEGSEDEGLGLVPNGLINVATDTESTQVRIQKLLREHPRSVGLRISPDTQLGFRGRKMVVRDGGAATVMIPGCEHLPPRSQTIRAVQDRRMGADNLIDWTEWRRDSIERTLEPFPPAEPKRPDVENGTLIIVGGGGMPDGLLDRFVEMAGGEEARLVYIPCSERDEIDREPGIVKSWKANGVADATYLHTKDREQANTDPSFYQPLETATGLMFGGGRQWNFSDSYYGTRTHALMKQVLERGGVVIGSSAGASIQARYLARATPIGNTSIMAPGYERGGLGFISGVAIDQHFSQRGRQPDMTELVDRYPQLLGIGIDEATAIIVQRSRAEVVGRGRVFFYDRTRPVTAEEPDYIALPAGSVYDLAEREILVDRREPK